MKVRQAARNLNAITISARDGKSLEPLLQEMERRFWSVNRDN
jgi:GTP-binding protein HflX